MRFLIIDDDKSFAADLSSIIESIPGDKNIDLAHSQDSAIRMISENFYDFILLDLKLPTIDNAFDQAVSSGQAVLDHAKNVAFGTPIMVVTGSVDEAEKYLPSIFQHTTREVVWGDNIPIVTVDHIAKGQLDKVRGKIEPILTSFNITNDIEINKSVNLELDVKKQRIIRIFARARNGTRCVISALGGGLSEAQVLKSEVFGSDGSKKITAVLKIADLATVESEEQNYRNHMERLNNNASPRHIGTIKYGAKDFGGACYRIENDFDNSLYTAISNNGDASASIIPNVAALTSPWAEGVGKTTLSVAEIRKFSLSDETLKSLVDQYNLNWVEAFEQRRIQVSWRCIHGDLHGENILTNNAGNPIIIDFGDVGEGPSALDPITLELSFLFHPKGNLIGQTWPTLENIAHWSDIDNYVKGCPFPEVMKNCRTWAKNIAGDREICVAAYSYLMKLLKYEDTNKKLILKLLEAVHTHFNTT